MEHILIPPHGNTLVNRILSKERAAEATKRAASLVKITLDEEQIKDVKNIARGVLSPLKGFMNEADFVRVVEDMRLVDGTVWPIPFVLAVGEDTAKQLNSGDEAGLVDNTGDVVALLHVADIFTFNPDHVSKHVFGTTDTAHPGVARWHAMPRTLVGGLIDLVDNSKEQLERSL